MFASSFDWFTGLALSFVIDQSDYLALVLRQSIKNH